ncbi:MBL fold metallo-hydrolase [Acidisoma cladoniae]|uniref:MBL fold metallo-hydrolase n=1 Tax=Acidisoma cladoniae TaxID=3040935 RepID=UPI002550A7ED|nr:MBL fold metallo-hydrolase [Acidisoma sp. PAMC 29798]
MKRIIDGAYLVPLGQANTVLLDAGPELVLVDAGFPGKATLVLDAIRQLGRDPRDLRHLVFTHVHPDHIGSAAEIVRQTGATTYMHAADAPFAEMGGPFRAMTAPPNALLKVMNRLVWHQQERMEPFKIDRYLIDGETLPLVGGLQVVHTPGHCAGQVALLWQGERLLIAGDVGMNVVGLSDPVGFEDIDEGRRSQRKVARLRFDAAVFGHGAMIRSGAAERVRSKWARV